MSSPDQRPTTSFDNAPQSIRASNKSVPKCYRCRIKRKYCDGKDVCGECKKGTPWHYCGPKTRTGSNLQPQIPAGQSLPPNSSSPSSAVPSRLFSPHQNQAPGSSLGSLSSPIDFARLSNRNSDTGPHPAGQIPEHFQAFEEPCKLSLDDRMKAIKTLRNLYRFTHNRRLACTILDRGLRISRADATGGDLHKQSIPLAERTKALGSLLEVIEKKFYSKTKKILEIVRPVQRQQKKGRLFDLIFLADEMWYLQQKHSRPAGDEAADWGYVSEIRQLILKDLAVVWREEGDYIAIHHFAGTHSTPYSANPTLYLLPVSPAEIEQANSDAEDAIRVYASMVDRVPLVYRKLLHNLSKSQYVLWTRRREVAKAIIVSNIAPEADVDALGRNIVHQVIELNDTTLLTAILPRYRFIINKTDVFGFTPLAVAVYLGNEDMVSLLVSPEVRADEWSQDLCGRRLICIASAAGHERLVSMLLRRGHQATCWKRDVGLIPLTEAVLGGHLPIVVTLLNANTVDVLHGLNSKHPNARPRLSDVARDLGHEEMAQRLLSAENRQDEIENMGFDAAMQDLEHDFNR